MQFLLERSDRAEREITFEDQPDDFGLTLLDEELPVLKPVAERNNATDPDSLLLRGRDLVADALACDLPLELREGEEDVERQPPHARRRVEALSDGNEGYALTVEEFNELSEVGEGTRQPVDLVDDDHIDSA